MRILLIPNNVFYEKKGSLFTYRAIGELASRLKEFGDDIEMIQTKLKKDEEFHDFDLGKTDLKVIALKRYKIKILTYFFVYIACIWRVYKSDFVYIFYPTNYHYLAFFALLFNKKYGLNVRGQVGVDSRLSRLLYRYAKVVFTVSPGFTEIVNNSKGIGVTQRPGISFTYKDIVSRDKISSKDSYNVLYLGRLDIEKGLIEFLQAIRMIIDKGVTNLKFIFVGDGYHDDLIKSKSASLGLDKYVFFHGPENNIERIKSIYLNADLFVMPTYHEGFPRTLYEAMIFGVPIITTFVGGIPYIMKEDINCLRIEPKSVDSIVNKISYAIKNYEDLESLVKNAENLVRKIIRPEKPSHADELHQYVHK